MVVVLRKASRSQRFHTTSVPVSRASESAQAGRRRRTGGGTWRSSRRATSSTSRYVNRCGAVVAPRVHLDPSGLANRTVGQAHPETTKALAVPEAPCTPKLQRGPQSLPIIPSPSSRTAITTLRSEEGRASLPVPSRTSTVMLRAPACIELSMSSATGVGEPR